MYLRNDFGLGDAIDRPHATLPGSASVYHPLLIPSYTIINQTELQGGGSFEWMEMYPERQCNSADVDRVMERSNPLDLYAAFNSEDLLLHYNSLGQMVPITLDALHEEWVKYPRGYCIRASSSAGDGHLEPHYGHSLYRALRQVNKGRMWFVAYRSGIEPVATNLTYSYNRYLGSKTFGQILQLSTDQGWAT